MDFVQSSRHNALQMSQANLDSLKQKAALEQFEKDQKILDHLPKLGRLPDVLKECTFNVMVCGGLIGSTFAAVYSRLRDNYGYNRNIWEYERQKDALVTGTIGIAVAAGIFSLVQTYRHTPTLPVFAANVVRTEKEAEAKDAYPQGSAEREQAIHTIAQQYKECIQNIKLLYSVNDKNVQRDRFNDALFVFKATDALPNQSASTLSPHAIEFLQKENAELE